MNFSKNLYVPTTSVCFSKLYVVVLAQWLERCSVKAEVAGPTPVYHPNIYLLKIENSKF